MALKDCLKKLGNISPADSELLEEYLADGLSDEQAVRKLLLSSYQNVIDITNRARTVQGVVAAPAKDVLVSVTKIQTRNLEKIEIERKKLTEKIDKLAEEEGEIGIIEDAVMRKSFGGGVDLSDDQAVMTSLSGMLFGNQNLRTKGVLGLKGKTPLQLLKSFRELQVRGTDIRVEISHLIADLSELDTRVNVIFSGKQQTFYQFGRDEAQGVRPKRGSISFDRNNRAVIRLTKARDLSTFLHESGHLYLEIMGDLAEVADAPEQTVADYAKILSFLGVKNRSEIDTEHHELWARSFEAYLMEGKAPSVEIQSIFNAFRSWLTNIYRKLNELNVDLTDDIRGVMDRLVASDDAITEAQSVQQFAAIYSTAEEMGVSQETFEVYLENVTKSHQDAVDDEARKVLATMNREAKRWWKDERNKVLEEVTAEVHGMRVYRALAMFRRGENPDGSTPERAPFKLSKEDLIRRKGKEFIKRLPRPFIYSAKGGVDLDVAAGVFGYATGDEMLQEILRAGNMDALIRAETDARMQQRFPDPLVDGSLHSDAIVFVHNEKRAQILAAELRALRRQMRADRKIVSATKRTMSREERQAREANAGQLPRRGELAIVKQVAARTIAAMRIRDVNPNKYLVAERKANRKAFTALGKKNYEVAYAEKLKSIHAHELYRAATRAKNESGQTQKYLKQFESLKLQRKLGRSDVLKKILALIEAIDFRKISLAQVDRDASLQEVAEGVHDGRIVMSGEQAAELFHVRIDDKTGKEQVILNRDFGTNWQDLTVEGFRSMRDTIRQLEHMAKLEVEAIVNGEKVILQDAKNEIITSLLENNKQIDFGVGELKAAENIKKNIKQGIHHWLNTGSIARILDDAGFGALTRLIAVPMRRASVEKWLPGVQKSDDDMAELYIKHYSNAELTGFGKKNPFPAMGEDMSKSDLLSVALHWGADGNRQALLGGIKLDGTVAYTEQGVRAALATLDARDWAFIQDVWDYLDSYWAELSEAERRRRGISPRKVEPRPFTIRTSDGQTVSLRGGYYPLRYDPRHSDRVKVDEFEDYFKKIGNGVYISANTRSGATYERKKNHGLVVRLGLGTIHQHLREVIRDISFGDEINFVKKLLNDKDVRNAFKSTGNEAALSELNLWLTDAAVGELPAQTTWDKAISWTRIGFVKSKLAFNVFVTALQFTGIFQSIAVIGVKHYSVGFAKFMQNPAGNYQHVMETSKFMKARYGIMQTFHMDVADTRAYLQAFFGPVPTKFTRAWDIAGHYYFWPIAKAQSLVDVTTWMGAVQKGRNELKLSEADAILYADSQVEASQTSGIFSDRSGLERGTLGTRTRQSQFVRLWTALISYMLRKGNLAYEKFQATKKAPTPQNIAFLLTDYVLLFMIEGIASALLYGRWPGEEDEDESLAIWVAKATADSVISGIPLVREFSVARYGSGNTPIGALANDMWDLQIQASQGEIDKALIKTGIKVGGTLFHLPASQPNRAIDAMFEDDPELYEYFTGTRNR